METSTTETTAPPPSGSARQAPMAEVFGMSAKDGMNSHPRSPKPIMATILGEPSDPALVELIPDVDPNHIYDPEITKALLIALELSMTAYIFGHAGTGKTTLVLQACARTRRPVLRVQHTETTEESHITGQWTVRDGSTIFQLGPLPVAMLSGAVYLADEIDFALPSVLAVYHAVLEGNPLVIKEAPPEMRVIRPHRDFRIIGTGNTNGSGDASGLYQGTRLQNAAMFSRWTLTEELGYLKPDIEARIITGQAAVPPSVSDKLVKFAAFIRQGFAAQRLGSTIGPRELIAAAKVGKLRGGNYRSGLASAATNRMSATDKVAADEVAQRLFG